MPTMLDTTHMKLITSLMVVKYQNNTTPLVCGKAAKVIQELKSILTSWLREGYSKISLKKGQQQQLHFLISNLKAKCATLYIPKFCT